MEWWKPKEGEKLRFSGDNWDGDGATIKSVVSYNTARGWMVEVDGLDQPIFVVDFFEV